MEIVSGTIVSSRVVDHDKWLDFSRHQENGPYISNCLKEDQPRIASSHGGAHSDHERHRATDIGSQLSETMDNIPR